MLAVAKTCLSNSNGGCLLEKQRYKYDFGGASRALLTHALHRPFLQSAFENPTDLLENMKVSNCQSLQPSKYADCTATLYNVRITNVRTL